MALNDKTILFICWSLFFSTCIQGQNSKIDSLTIELQNHKEKDTTRVNLLYDLAYFNFQNDMNLTKTYLKEVEDLSNDLNYTRGKAKLNYLRGMLENMKSNYSASLNYFERSLKYYQSIQDKNRIASVYIAFGINHYDLAMYEEALNDYKKGTQIYQDIGNKRDFISGLINTGNVYSELGRYDEAISNYKQALKQNEVINDESIISDVYINLGEVYKVQGNYPLAIDYLNISLGYDIKTRDTLSMTILLNNLGEVYTSMGKYDKALDYHKQSLNFSVKKENKSNVAISNANIGKIYRYRNEYEEALKYYHISLKTSLEISNAKQTSKCFNNIGDIYLLLNKPLIARENFIKAKDISLTIGHQEALSASFLGIAESYLYEKQYTEALNFAKKGKNIAEEIKILGTQKKAAELLYKIYKNTQDYKESLEIHEQFKILNDSLFNKENFERISQLEYDYKYKRALDSASIRELKLTKEVSSINTSLERSQRNIFLTIIVLLLTALILGGIIFFLKWRNIKEKNQNVLIEQKLLRSQMTPHFIFNSLSVLQGMILNKEENKSIAYLSKFSKLLRIVLENSRDKMVPLIQELDAIDNYMILQNLDADPPYDYSLVVDENININLFLIPPMLIQPFIENAIEHAFTVDKDNREIEVRLKFKDKKLSCTIADNGIGIEAMSPKVRTNKKSLATTITGERLTMLAKEFKVSGAMIIEDRKKYNSQGTIVTLTIPYKLSHI